MTTVSETFCVNFESVNDYNIFMCIHHSNIIERKETSRERVLDLNQNDRQNVFNRGLYICAGS